MNSFERFYNDYMAWKAMRAFSLFACLIAVGIVWGWYLGVSNILDYLKLQEPIKVELHSFDGQDFTDSSLGKYRSCKALIDIGTGKYTVDFYSSDKDPKEQGSAEHFCRSRFASIGQWEDRQVTRSTGLLEKAFWLVIVVIVFLFGLGMTIGVIFLIDELGFGGRVLIRVLAVPVLIWYAASLVIFCIGAFDESTSSWSDGEVQIQVQRLWLTKDGKVRYRPHTLLGWTDSETMSVATGEVSEELLASFTAPSPASQSSGHIGIGQLAPLALSGEVKLYEIDGVDGESSIYQRLKGSVKPISIHDPSVAPTEVFVEFERCRVREVVPTHEDQMVLVDCLTPSGKPLVVIGGGLRENRKTLEELRAVSASGKYYAIGRILHKDGRTALLIP